LAALPLVAKKRSHGKDCVTTVVLEHRRSQKYLVVTTALMICFVGPFLYFLAYWSNFSPLFVWGGIFLFVFNLLMFVAELYWVARYPNGFHCTLTQSRFCCGCPVVSSGDSFDVALTDIQELVKSEESESHSYYFKTRDGATYWISPNYSNPARKFFEAIQKLRPDIATKVTREWVVRTSDEEENLSKRGKLAHFLLTRKRSFGISVIEVLVWLFFLGICAVLALQAVMFVIQLFAGS